MWLLEAICFCDSDDYFEVTMVEKLYKEAVRKDADIVMCDIYREVMERRFSDH